MPYDLNFYKDLADLFLTLVLTVATIYLAVYTYKLVDEARLSRKAQVQPYISVYLDQAETDPTLLFIIIQNIGQGTAYDLTFDVQKDIGNYGTQAHQISNRGLFRDGMKFCPPNYLKKYFLVETRNNPKEKIEEELIFVAKYANTFKEEFHQRFHLKLKEQSMSSKISPSDTYIGSIAENISAIRQALQKDK